MMYALASLPGAQPTARRQWRVVWRVKFGTGLSGDKIDLRSFCQ